MVQAQDPAHGIKGELLYQSSMADSPDIAEWVMEGPGKVSFSEGWMDMQSPEETGHHVFWCPDEFPESFVAQWELQNLETDAGLCIVFFSAKGQNGESIFDPGLSRRDGVFNQYTRGDINCYHISYYANAAHNPDRPHANLRKNSGFHLVQEGAAPIPASSTEVYTMTLIKDGAHIILYANDRKLIDWKDDGITHGPVLGEGRIGLRQMKWTHFKYRNFKVWDLQSEAQPHQWIRHQIDGTLTGADGIKMADFNQDGKTDIVTGWEESGITKLYLNPGSAHVRLPWPSVVVGSTPSVEDALFFDAVGDTSLEIVSLLEGDAKSIQVHEFRGDTVLNPESWTQSPLPAASDRMQWMYGIALDVDHKEGIDLVAAGKGASAQLGWFQSPGLSPDLDGWKWYTMSPVGWIMSIMAQDMDGDGDQDVIITDRRGPFRGCRWLENPYPDLNQQEWVSHMIGAGELEVMFMAMEDLDGDGVDEMIVPERTINTIRILKQSGGVKDLWSEKVIQLPSSTGMAKSVASADMNDDGIKDLVISTNTGKNSNKHGLTWLDGRHLPNPRPEDFLSISGPHLAKYDQVILHDVDNDGDLDILICEENYGDASEGLGIIWYENRLKKG